MENNSISNGLSDNEMLDSQHQCQYTSWFFQNCPDMIFLFDEQLRLISCSAKCRPLLRSADITELENTFLKDVFSPDLGDNWVQNIYQQNSNALATLSPCHFDDTIIFGDKEFICVQIVVSPMLDEEKKCRGTIMTMSDITEVVKTKQRAEEAARSKSSFLANMSHEIRTPMNAVKGLSELLALTELSSLQRNYVKNIISSANSLLGIINDVLDFSKIDANKIDFIENSYDIAALITGVCNVVSMRADDKNLLLLINASPDLPSALWGDDVRIKQVITNLLSNAVKYTSKGYVSLNVHTEERDGSTWLCCSVEDSGIGIRPEDIPLLFCAFSRADLISNRNIAGTGLGLAISKQLVLAMGGDISVESVYGKGSTFTFSIPQKVMDPSPIAKLDDMETKRVLVLGIGSERLRNLAGMLESLGVFYTHIENQEELEGIDLNAYTHCISDGSFSERRVYWLCEQMPGCLFAALKNMRHAMSISDYQDTILYLPIFIADLVRFLNRYNQDEQKPSSYDTVNKGLKIRDALILVVDDNEINLIVSSEMLHSFEGNVVCAESGEEALSLCEQQKFDIIFMDHMMPGMDGIETTLKIRKSQNINCKTPIIALTANVVNDMESVYLSSGMDDFVGKPIELSDISRVLRKWLPKEKVCMEGEEGTTRSVDTEEAYSPLLSPEDIIAAFDNFGLYSSDVMREMNGDFEGYISRMENASNELDDLVLKLKSQVTGEHWEDFSRDCLKLHSLLYGIGARDCAARSRKLAVAGREHNVDYIYEDFFSLMGNMYMLDKKLGVIVPFSRSDNRYNLPLGSSKYLHGCLEKMGRALLENDAAKAMEHLEDAAAFSLDMDLDMALKTIKADLEKNDFESATAHHAAIYRAYTRMVSL